MNTETTIVLSSLTYAMKGKRLLEGNGIRARVVRPAALSEGCGYGLSVSYQNEGIATEILRRGRLRIVKIITI